jgi:hypothetical protein
MSLVKIYLASKVPFNVLIAVNDDIISAWELSATGWTFF